MATMRLGTNAKIYIDTSSGYKPVGNVTDWSIDTSRDRVDVTSFGDQVTSYVAGLPTATFTISGILDSETYTLFADPNAKFSVGGGKQTKEQPKHMQIYEYAAIYKPEDDDGNVIKKDCRILIEPAYTLAESETAVKKLALREVKLDEGDNLEYVVVAVRPFASVYQ